MKVFCVFFKWLQPFLSALFKTSTLLNQLKGGILDNQEAPPFIYQILGSSTLKSKQSFVVKKDELFRENE